MPKVRDAVPDADSRGAAALKRYRAKRDFKATPEPSDGGEASTGALTFVVQKHWASRLHYDFRLELDGTMKSWAVPKGPSFDSADKRLAVEVEDHPISYAGFEGQIPAKQYGAGKVIIWDKGFWTPVGDPHQSLRDGNLKFELQGHKLQGHWALVRMKGRGDKQPPWLLVKERDGFVRAASDFSVVDEMPDSVKDMALPARVASLVAAPPAVTAKPSRAPHSALPEILAPQLATLVDKPPGDSEDWVYEIKFDGYRLLARIDRDIRLFTRNGNDWTAKLKPLQKALAELALPAGWYDGEIVVTNAAGVPDFGALQQSFDVAKTGAIVYYLFDVPFCDGRDLRQQPLTERRTLLQQLLEGKASERVRFSEVFDAPPHDVVTSACKLGLEGVIAKRRDSTYVSRRSGDWIKLKCSHRQEFVIGGYTDPQGTRTGIGSLLLGVHDEAGQLLYAGNVGTGFSERALKDLTKKLKTLDSERSPFADTGGVEGRPHWVRPELVAEVTFGEWTRSGRVRHSVFHGLRADKPPSSIVRERPAAAAKAASTPATRSAKAAKSPKAEASHALSTRLKITHPERVIDAASGTTKLELVRYYGLVGPLMMAHLKDRPVSLVRAPGGIGKPLFFQKHAEVEKMPGVRQLDARLDPGHAPMLAIDSEQGLLSAAQWNTVEIHSMNALAASFDKPDRMVFDLDPGEGVQWAAMQEAAELVHVFLYQLGLPSFLKTSGGKGLHVVVPLRRLHDWATVKGFSQAIVQHLAGTIGERFVAKSGPRNRVGKIFIDYLRNGEGSTTVCAWSARARPGMGISVPMGWSELQGLPASDHWNVRNAQTRLDQGNAPWDGYAKAAISLTAAMKRLGWRRPAPA